MHIRTLLLAMSVCLPGFAQGPFPAGDQVAIYPDQDFENETLVWGVWPADTTTRVELDRAIAQHGRQSLRMTAADVGARAFALAGIGRFEPNVIYRITVHLRRDPTIPDAALSFFINYREGSDTPIKTRQHAFGLQRATVGDWERWSGYFGTTAAAPHGQFLLGLEHAAGRVWWDNVQIERLVALDSPALDVWTNLTLGLETGAGPLRRFLRHRDGDTPVFRMARRYDALLWRSALLERDLRDAERCAFHAGRALPAARRAAFDRSERLLNDAHLAYAAALAANVTSLDPVFGTAADRLSASLDVLEQGLVADRQAFAPAAAPVLPAHLGRQDLSVRAINPDGSMNRLLFGSWSPLDFAEAERVFGFEFCASAPGRPKVHTETETDFSNIREACDRVGGLGFSGTFSYLGFGIHQYLYAPAWLLEKHRAEPDFVKVSVDGALATPRGSEVSLNYFHPAVRAYIRDYLGRYAAFCRDEPRVLFHEFAQEAYPGFTTANGRRTISYGPSQKAAFADHLRGRYPSIAALNQAWGSAYPDFAAVVPPPDPQVETWSQPSPLTAEFAAFAEQAYIDFLRLCYTALKAADPDKPVVARHSALLDRINGARIFETCDVLSAHGRAPRMTVYSIYLNSLNRYHRKGLGYMEDFWGVQEEADRISDERAQRRGLEKHVAREGLWGRTLQMKWYSYTTGSYVFTYNGNWRNVRTDLTTWRYCAPALAVAKQKLETLDWMLTHSRIAPAKVLVLQPSASMRNEPPGNPPFGEIMALHAWLGAAGMLYELVPEEYIEDGRCRLADFGVVVLPKAKYLSGRLQDSIGDFVERGGMLLALGRPAEFDELARPAAGLLPRLRRLAAVGWPDLDAAWQVPAGDAAPGFAAVSCGRGQVVASPGMAHLARAPGSDALAGQVQEAAPRAAWAEGGRFEVLLRIAEDGGRYLCLLNPSVDEPAEDAVWVRGAAQGAVDVTVPGGYPVRLEAAGPNARLALRLGPGEMAVLLLVP